MKKNRFLIILFCVFILGIGAITAYAIENSSGAIIEDNSTESVSEELLELQKKGAERIGSYLYQEKVIAGEADPSMERMDLYEVRQIIADRGSFDDILTSFNDRQMYPDFAGGSGVSIIEYWLDPSGKEKIVIILEQSEIYYENSESETCSIELLYH